MKVVTKRTAPAFAGTDGDLRNTRILNQDTQNYKTHILKSKRILQYNQSNKGKGKGKGVPVL
jgi:hypothetical protein